MPFIPYDRNQGNIGNTMAFPAFGGCQVRVRSGKGLRS
jgi:hypothetical protein